MCESSRIDNHVVPVTVRAVAASFSVAAVAAWLRKKMLEPGVIRGWRNRACRPRRELRVRATRRAVGRAVVGRTQRCSRVVLLLSSKKGAHANLLNRIMMIIRQDWLSKRKPLVIGLMPCELLVF